MHPPASPGRREVRILYAAQTGVAPPTFVLFTNVATEFHFSYERFLVNRLRESFGFIGTPIRIQVRRRDKKAIEYRRADPDSRERRVADPLTANPESAPAESGSPPRDA